MPERTVQGTHKEVVILSDVHAIAALYPDLPDFFGVFSSSSFFYEYELAISESIRRLKRDIESGRFGWKGIGHPDEIRGRIADYAGTHKWSMVFNAWKEKLVAEKNKPPVSLFPPFFSEYTTNPQFVVENGNNITIYSLIDTISNRSTEERIADQWRTMDVKEKANTLSPLNYFPPLENTSLLDILFYDPSNPDDNDRIMDLYVNDVGIDLLEKLISAKKPIKYSDIITPIGYGFRVDFSAVGLSLPAFMINVEDVSFFNENYLVGILGEKYKKSSRTSTYPDGRVVTTISIPRGEWPWPNLASKEYLNRDSWIQCWGMRGRIPISLTEIATKELAGLKTKTPKFTQCSHLSGMYPIRTWRKGYSLLESFAMMFDDVFEIAMVAGGIYMAAQTGHFAGLVKGVTGILIKSIKRDFPSISRYADLAMPLVIAPFLNEMEKDYTKKDEAKSFLTSISEMQISMMSPQEYSDFDFQLDESITLLNENLSQDQKRIISAIAIQVDANSYTFVKNAMANRAWNKPGLVGSMLQAMNNKKKSDNMMLLAGGIVGGALLLKILKK